MYDLVREVESYPDFLPWCSGANIIEQFNDGVIASIDISKAQLKKTFTTRNSFVLNKEIKMQLVDGPFSKLQGAWRFEAIGQLGCRVSLYLEFDFSSTLVSLTVGPVFDVIANKLLDAFVAQANIVYEQ